MGSNADAYLKFDLTGISGNIGSAKLSIYAAIAAPAPDTASTTLRVYPTPDTSWIESGLNSITWNRKPTIGNSSTLGLPVLGTTKAWYTFDVTDDVRKSIGNTFITLALHNDATAALTCISTVSKEGGTPPQLVINRAPDVNITSPADKTKFDSLANLVIKGNVNDSDGSVAKIDLYDGITPVRSTTKPSSPYTLIWNTVPSGFYSLSVKATDNTGDTATSSAIHVGTGNSIPLVSTTSPANNSVFTAPADITLSAIASKIAAGTSVETIKQVDFYQGSTFIGKDVKRPGKSHLSYTWRNVVAGTYAVTALAVDSSNNATTSAPVMVVVNGPGPASPFTYLGYSKLATPVAVPQLAQATRAFDDLSSMLNYGAPSTLKNSMVYVKSRSTINDGGQGWWSVQATGRVDDVIAFVSKVDSSLIFKRYHSGELNIRLAGATGDGATDDTSNIQKVLDTKFDVVGSSAVDIYSVKAPADCIISTTRALPTPISTYPLRTALVLYSGQSLNLKGATIKLADRSDGSVLINQALYKYHKDELAKMPPGTVPALDQNIAIENGVIDGNVNGQTTTGLNGGKDRILPPTLFLGTLKNSTLRDLTIKNFYTMGISFRSDLFRSDGSRDYVTDIAMDNIAVDGGLGLGIDLNGKRFISNRNIEIYDTRPFPLTYAEKIPWDIYPNSIAIATNDSDYATIYAEKCAWGFKLQNGSVNNRFA